jgi:nitrate/nitrite transporter NarK
MEDPEFDLPVSRGIKAWFDSRTEVFKGWILLGACFLTFGSYYCYDIVGALSPVLLDPFYQITTTQESFLYAVYSLPNTVIPFFGGFLVDRVLGVRYVLRIPARDFTS